MGSPTGNGDVSRGYVHLSDHWLPLGYGFADRKRLHRNAIYAGRNTRICPSLSPLATSRLWVQDRERLTVTRFMQDVTRGYAHLSHHWLPLGYGFAARERLHCTAIYAVRTTRICPSLSPLATSRLWVRRPETAPTYRDCRT